MNPDPIVMAALADRHYREQKSIDEKKARLHKAAVERRRKSKKGGKR